MQFASIRPPRDKAVLEALNLDDTPKVKEAPGYSRLFLRWFYPCLESLGRILDIPDALARDLSRVMKSAFTGPGC